MEENIISEVKSNENNKNELSLWSYSGYIILFFIPIVITFNCLLYFKGAYDDIINIECFYIILFVAIINIVITSIFSFVGKNINRKNLAKSFLIIGCFILIMEICNIGKFKPMDEYIISKLNEVKGTYPIEHIKGADLKNIIENIDDDQYNVTNFNVDEIDKNARYTIVIDEGYIDTIVVTEIE